jgi:hypothetical protein
VTRLAVNIDEVSHLKIKQSPGVCPIVHLRVTLCVLMLRGLEACHGVQLGFLHQFCSMQ